MLDGDSVGVLMKIFFGTVINQRFCKKMSARRGGGSGGKPVGAAANESSSRWKNASEVAGPKVGQLAQGVGDISLESEQDDGWEVARKHKNKSGSSVGKPWGTSNPNPNAWGNPDVVQRLGFRDGPGKVPANACAAPTAYPMRPSGRGNAWAAPTADPMRPAGRGNAWPAPTAVVAPLERGCDWRGRSSSTQPFVAAPLPKSQNYDQIEDLEDDEDNPDELEDDDEDLASDEYDTDDDSQKSHEERKMSRWFKPFFDILDSLTVEQINEPARQWHCSACQGGPGAIDWYRGLQPLITHAKTKGSKRVKLHRELAELLDEELRRRGTSAIPAGEAFGKWKGLSEKVVKDKEIVWPPMVIIMNTQLERDENDKVQSPSEYYALTYTLNL